MANDSEVTLWEDKKTTTSQFRTDDCPRSIWHTFQKQNCIFQRTIMKTIPVMCSDVHLRCRSFRQHVSNTGVPRVVVLSRRLAMGRCGNKGMREYKLYNKITSYSPGQARTTRGHTSRWCTSPPVRSADGMGTVPKQHSCSCTLVCTFQSAPATLWP